MSSQLPGHRRSSERLHIGQLLVQLTREMQAELFLRLRDAGLEEVRIAHFHVTAYIKAEGSRLTDLAAMARMTPAAISEQVDDLERLGIVERRPDPADRRAKLICITDEGWETFAIARGVIQDLERRYAELVGPEAFEQAATTLDALLAALRTSEEARPRPGEGD